MRSLSKLIELRMTQRVTTGETHLVFASLLVGAGGGMLLSPENNRVKTLRAILLDLLDWCALVGLHPRHGVRANYTNPFAPAVGQTVLPMVYAVACTDFLAACAAYHSPPPNTTTNTTYPIEMTHPPALVLLSILEDLVVECTGQSFLAFANQCVVLR